MKRILPILYLLYLFTGPSLAFGADRVVVIPLFSNTGQSCPEGLSDCAGKCVDTDNNPEFCGDCDLNCGADQYCSQGVCVRHDGLSCTDSSGCLSGNCVDGVCCDTSCDSLCFSCLAADTGGTDGSCAPISYNTDPDTECMTNQRCDGVSECKGGYDFYCGNETYANGSGQNDLCLSNVCLEVNMGPPVGYYHTCTSP